MKLFDKLIAKSPVAVALTEAIRLLAVETQGLARAVLLLANQVNVHHGALQELYARQGLVMKAVKSGSLDVSMPDIHGKDKPAKSN